VQLTSCLGNILCNDYPEKWPNYLKDIHDLLMLGDEKVLNGALLGIQELVKVYRYVKIHS